MCRVLGLDGGGTKTIAAIADRSGTVLDLSFNVGLDPTAGPGWEGLLAEIVAPFGRVDAAALGLPFHGEISAVSARQIAVAAQLIGPQAQVLNDVAVAFEGALAGESGVLILAGTGSMAWARGPRGTVRSGGWGDAFGDEGSAYWIGREALSIVSHHLDGRKAAPAFAENLLDRIGIPAEALIGWTYLRANLRAGIASVAANVSALALQGDAEAKQLMERAAWHLAELGRAVATVSGLTAPVPWSYAGGVFRDAGLLAAVTRAMGPVPAPPRLPPVGGAILCAAKAAGWAIDDGFIARLGSTLAASLCQNSNTAALVTS